MKPGTRSPLPEEQQPFVGKPDRADVFADPEDGELARGFQGDHGPKTAAFDVFVEQDRVFWFPDFDSILDRIFDYSTTGNARNDENRSVRLVHSSRGDSRRSGIERFIQGVMSGCRPKKAKFTFVLNAVRRLWSPRKVSDTSSAATK